MTEESNLIERLLEDFHEWFYLQLLHRGYINFFELPWVSRDIQRWKSGNFGDDVKSLLG